MMPASILSVRNRSHGPPLYRFNPSHLYRSRGWFQSSIRPQGTIVWNNFAQTFILYRQPLNLHTFLLYLSISRSRQSTLVACKSDTRLLWVLKSSNLKGISQKSDQTINASVRQDSCKQCDTTCIVLFPYKPPPFTIRITKNCSAQL